MIGSPAVMTPPTVWTVDWNTVPSCGARMSMRLSWSSAVTLRSTNSPILPSISRVSLATSLLRSWSIWRICSSVSAILPLACAVGAINWRARLRAASPRARAGSGASSWIRFCFHRSRTPASSRSISSISLALASRCASRPRISSLQLPDPLLQLLLLADRARCAAARTACARHRASARRRDRAALRRAIRPETRCSRCRRARLPGAPCARSAR